MVEKEVLLTSEGLEKLEKELKNLRGPKRREIAEKIKVAIGFGDLSENAEYDEAKNEQAQIEDRIMVLEDMLRHAKTIDQSSLSKDVVNIGATVLVKDMEYDEDLKYTIVGSAEADPVAGKISNVSPVGKALIGGKVGDIVKADTPGGILEFEILEISI